MTTSRNIMSVLSSLPSADLLIRKMVIDEGRTLSEVCVALKSAYPHISRGLSERSIRRYCAANNIHASSRLKDSAVDRVVWTNILKVCSFQFNSYYYKLLAMHVHAVYGRKTMTGLLAADGLRVAKKRVGNSLKKVCPLFHNRRLTSTHKRTNPIPYFAKYQRVR